MHKEDAELGRQAGYPHFIPKLLNSCKISGSHTCAAKDTRPMGSDDVSLVSSFWFSKGSQCLHHQGQVIEDCDHKGIWLWFF